MRKRLIKLFLCMMMFCMMIPIVAFAETGGNLNDNVGALPKLCNEVTEYDVWLGGVRVSSTNCGDITAAINTIKPGLASGEAKYVPATATEPAKLELNNFAFNGEGYKLSSADDYRTYDFFYGLYFKGNLEIVLTGENKITEASEEIVDKGRTSYGIGNDSGSLTISGTGTLASQSGDCTITKFNRDNETAGIKIIGDLFLKDTVSVSGIGGDVDTQAEIRGDDYTWTDGKSINTYGVSCYSIKSESKTTCEGIGGNVKLTDSVENAQEDDIIIAKGYSCGIRGCLESIEGAIAGKGGDITLVSNNTGNDFRYLSRYLSGSSRGIFATGIIPYVTPVTPNITGSLTAEGGEISAENNDYIKAESYGMYRGDYGTLNIAADDFIVSGETAALNNYSYFKVCYSSDQKLLLNTDNSATGDNVKEDSIKNENIPDNNGTQSYKYISITASYSVNISGSSNMTRKADSGSSSQLVAKEDAIKDVVYTADEGYYFPENYSVAAVNGISVTRNSENQITVSGTPTAETNISLIAPTAKVKEDKPSDGNKGGGGVTKYPITVSDKVENASVKVSAEKSSKNDKITVTVTPDKGYKVEKIVVTDKKGNEIAVTDNGDKTYSFKMPSSAVTIEPVIVTDSDSQNIQKFVDVTDDAYFAKPVYWAAEKNITKGMDNTHFGPDKSCTRGQIVTFIWRFAGCPEPKNDSCPFVDITEKDYCYKAVLWAFEKGIAKGVDNNHFGPDVTVSRGQSVTFLYRFAGSDISVGNENQFIDINAGDYFYNAVLWAAENEITSGTDKTTFSPNADCIREQIVTFLYRYDMI